MISHDHRCIFVHVPKAAGSSIEAKLGFFEQQGNRVRDHRTVREIEPFRPGHLASLVNPADPYLYRHWRNHLKGKSAPTAAQYADYYKFTFVRNSWSRVYSWYRNVTTNERHRRRIGLTGRPTLAEFLRNHGDEWGLRSQLYWIRDSRGGLPYDRIGRFENLQADFDLIGKDLGLDDPTLPRMNVGGGGRYTEAYDDASIDLVARRYAEEIALFGFVYGE